ncbi:MAG: T9SS type B sorting domain-containing protein, partial [Bacteroidia bacterium]|nr:T9SS type B sorting domain-containing protein [Bacteroidia bacterium]
TPVMVAQVVNNEVVYLDALTDYSIQTYEYYIVANEDYGGNNANSVSNKIELEQDAVVYVPNAFSPNGDGLNETWGASLLFVNEIHIQVYNRFGLLIFETNQPYGRWDGTYEGEMVQQGNYVYVVKYNGILDRRMKTLKGNLVLLR